ncbi:MAG: cell division protein FtsQ/DivIB [Gammaproteobacteria bacterium]
MLAAVVWGGARLVEPTTLPIRKVRLAGSFAHVSPDRIRGLVAARVHGGFFGVDVAKVQKLVEGLPWVDHASVRRVWPDTLAIDIDEQRPLARWAAGGLVNARGQVFRPDPKTYPSGLPVFDGPPDTAATLAERFRRVRERLAPLGLRVRSLSLDKRRAWRLGLANDIELVLGREDSLARLRRFAEVYPKVLAPRAGSIARVDLRYTNGFAVAWRQGSGNQTTGTHQG